MVFIGDYFIKKGLLTQGQLNEALEEQKRSGGKIGDFLIKKGYVSEKDFTLALSEQLGIPFVDISSYDIDKSLIKLFDLSLVRRYKFIPLSRVMTALMIAMVDPLDILVVDEIRRACGLTIRPAIATPSAINYAIKKYYEGQELSAEATPAEVTARRGEIDMNDLVREASGAPVITLVNSLFTEAVDAGASDIHIEPEEKNCYVRLRIDGVLQDARPIAKDLELAVISRIKILADMDIAEKRLPQDGRVKTSVLNKEVDLRISTFPTIYGENISIRLLDKTQGIFKLEDLGFQKDVLEIIKVQVKRPYGIVLVTGPTGSGKTTTLYAVLNLINDLKKNIITLEDPIEYVVPRVCQSQVNVKAGLTFATGLRAILRHDPDIIMIGEIRDRETAEISIHSALTGHLVFSTLHTNDAAAAASRLIDMGIEPFLVASALSAIIAQRLVRRLCPKCKKAYKPTEAEIVSLGFPASTNDLTLYKEVGCSNCRSTGFKGRTGIFELLVLNDGIKELILEKSPPHQIVEYAINNGMRTLRNDGLEKLTRGEISASEVLRASREI
ncbi:MAG: ATPase, T2SS/T4P/T4SS family [Candidatus Omnitrophota bacterium]